MTGGLARWLDAWSDLSGTWTWRPFWATLAWQDVRQRFFGTRLGSLWIIINLGATIGALSLIFHRPFAVDIKSFLPYVAAGIVFWRFIQSTLSEAGLVLVAARDSIRNVPIPVSAHFARLVWRNFLALCHEAVVLVVVAVGFGHAAGLEMLLIIPGMLILLTAVFAASLIVGMLGARFRDFPPLVSSLLQLLFFATPIFWLPEIIGPSLFWLVEWNPVVAFLDLVRQPYLGEYPANRSWLFALGVTGSLAIMAATMLALGRRRVAYWI